MMTGVGGGGYLPVSSYRRKGRGKYARPMGG